jgi:hypothetical protein
MVERADSNWEARGRGALDEFAVRARRVGRRSTLDAAAVEALHAFDQAGVDALLLKGVALTRTLYRSNEHRGYVDVDLLVGPDDFAAAERALADLGYVDFVEESGLDPFPDDPHAVLWSRITPAIGPTAVDLHWRLPGCHAPPLMIWNALRTRRTWIDLCGYQAAILERPGLALHIAIHAAQHGPDDLKALGDLVRGLERWSEEVWRHAAQLAYELQATEAFGAGMRLVPAGVSMARQLQLPGTDALLRAIAHRHLRPRGTFHARAFVEAKGLRERVSVLRRSLFPTRHWIVWEHAWAARGGLSLCAAYGMHLLRCPAWAARVWHSRRRARRETG